MNARSLSLSLSRKKEDGTWGGGPKECEPAVYAESFRACVKPGFGKRKIAATAARRVCCCCVLSRFEVRVRSFFWICIYGLL